MCYRDTSCEQCGTGVGDGSASGASTHNFCENLRLDGIGTGGGSGAAAFGGVGSGTAVNEVNWGLDWREGLEGR